MKSNWNYPTTMWVGEDRIKDLSIACKTLNIKKPSSFKFFKTLITIFDLARPLSVTNNGLLISKVLQAILKSLILFSPTHMVVG